MKKPYRYAWLALHSKRVIGRQAINQSIDMLSKDEREA